MFLKTSLLILCFAASSVTAQPQNRSDRDKGVFVEPGKLLPLEFQNRLHLTPDQKKSLDQLQDDLDVGLRRILTKPQLQRLDELAGRSSTATRRESVPTPHLKLRSVSVSREYLLQSVEKSHEVLWRGVEGHSEKRSCFTCHNHAVPMLAFATARDRGVKVSEEKLKELIDFVVADVERNRDRFARGQGPGPPPAGGETDNSAYMLLALEAAGNPLDDLTGVVVDYTLKRDRNLDYWYTPAGRAPSEASSITTTALCIRGITKFGQSEHRDRVAKKLGGAKKWLLKANARDTEDRVFRLIGLRAVAATDAEIALAANQLTSTQRLDGGWSQLPQLGSDAYATGSALWALHTAGGMSVSDPIYIKGLKFLLATQEEDGSWHVPTRSRPVQRYFETGFPYGKDQFISTAATGWAATAIALALPNKK